eukprot:COSAG06_NODE_22673_length_716_cov_0.975689_1_plen_29_part_10
MAAHDKQAARRKWVAESTYEQQHAALQEN